ncbi:pilus assembly protein CpaD [Rhizobiales bacterium GAS191]|nr:pilus assembly protein CpaD [Rhizobiales bacterium GAS191]
MHGHTEFFQTTQHRMRLCASPSGTGLFAGLALSLALGGCGVDRMVPNAGREPSDYRARHPIVMADKSHTLDIFVGANAGPLDLRQREDLRAFVQEFRERGKGVVTAFVPIGSTDPGGEARGIETIRAALGRGRVPLSIQTYAVEDPSLAAPIRLSFAELAAKVSHSCGRWPKDLSGSTTREGIENEQYWNFGCAYQQNIAAQVADPIDLVRPHVEDRIDVIKRTTEIGKLRQGQDPATSYDTKNKASISNLGGGGT